ncbi:hypothetical protein M409DRAFT_31031 [Zasmidium cellare ATCC 36951]|uniref:Uncharacterized protein n=1 Tax=Zasmidium cellare ATCC 36951 TaxID=1080233 RepID=A0A6A6BY15_ZASCE|nr:uncharacterized protein M409DRAFT_31031 [Zasmidium cellare ATCC 36951]KAF2158452.1 hypothetical protein M409DRAFT_31031 [Zasmidium cellare ATCC 36951]
MAFQPVFDPLPSKPTSQSQRDLTGVLLVILRDNFTISTWLMLGALIQGILSFLPYPNIALVAPVAMVLLFQITRTALQSFGILKNPRMDGVIPGRTAVVYPNEKDGQQNSPGNKQVCAIILSIRSNHPLGMLAKGFKESGDYFDQMLAELDKDATKYGYLGASGWISAADRGYASEKMGMLYFESAEKVHEYAHGPLHTKAMQWWIQAHKSMPHIGLMHEILEAPKGSWEGIYMNHHPTGLGATSKEVEINGNKVWMNPLVRAKGPLLWSKGRMGKESGAKDWQEFHDAVVQEEGEAFFKV